jgi:hypothetical protein
MAATEHMTAPGVSNIRPASSLSYGIGARTFSDIFTGMVDIRPPFRVTDSLSQTSMRIMCIRQNDA